MKPLLRILFDAAANHALQGQRHIRGELRDRRRLFVENGADGVGLGGSLKSPLAHNHLIKDCAEGKDIGAMVGHLSADLLRGHITHCAHRDAMAGDGDCQMRGRLRQGGDFGQTEIENLDASVFGDEKVLRLEVAMHDAFFVRCGQPVSDLHRKLDRLTQGQGTAPQAFSEGLSFQKLSYEVRCSVVSSHLKDGKNIGVAQRRGGLGLDLEALQSVRFGRY